MDAAIARAATRAGQTVLRSSGSRIAVDGRWGRYTQQAYVSASATTRYDVDEATTKYGPEYTPANLFANFSSSSTKASPEPNWIHEDKANAIVERAAAVAGVSAAAMKGMLALEPTVRYFGGQKYYDSMSRSGSFKGLFQMGEAAWKTASRMNRALPTFAQGVYDPYTNALAASFLLKANAIELRRRGVKTDITAEIAYAMHNQGVGGFLSYLKTRTSIGDQSAEAEKVLDRKSVV